VHQHAFPRGQAGVDEVEAALEQIVSQLRLAKVIHGNHVKLEPFNCCSVRWVWRWRVRGGSKKCATNKVARAIEGRGGMASPKMETVSVVGLTLIVRREISTFPGGTDARDRKREVPPYWHSDHAMI
jgi:hypothetical protein